MDNNVSWYYTDKTGSQTGPVSTSELRKLIEEGRAPSMGVAWKEGMDNWLPMSQIEELKTTNLDPLSPPKPAPEAGQPGASVNPYSAPQTQVRSTASGSDYPIPEVKRTNYLFFAAPMIIGILILIVGFVLLEVAGIDLENPSSYENKVEPSDEMLTTLIGSIVAMVVGFLLVIIASIVGMVYLYRAWKVIQPGGAQTTPGKAVGYCFIPFYNIYWVFIAYWKWSQEWNRITSSYNSLASAPKANEGLFLAYPITNIVGLFVSFVQIVSLVFYMINIKQMCNAVNFIYDLGLDQRGHTH